MENNFREVCGKMRERCGKNPETCGVDTYFACPFVQRLYKEAHKFDSPSGGVAVK